ncbi:NAD-dependent epimerase/dehydratase family protein [Kaistella sp. G5-32]|uniref:NAD-dependent epimerase/dehydratase family protein n=1 Tax=Kaistella gelatinilytica TaxID=2787636 RepID=A0ABS0FAA4_9FLAO|nr:NAD-dependent epimerase/dehydratase family protein [Kaistella gelatinilytica]MBF8456586.1 NAD-dependent epimerase/dehydratase family protein [Kaistella gelatinilytica]
MKNILITGGAGFIGSNLALKLIDKGYAVTVLDTLSEQIHGKDPDENSPLFLSIKGKVRFIKGDITNRNDVEKAIEDQDAIIHLAAETGTGQSMYQIEKYSHVNVYGSSLILDVLVNKKNSVKKFILASSRAVYGEGKYENVLSEISYPSERNVELMQKGIFEMTDEKGEFLKPLPTDENSKLHPTSFYGITKLQQEEVVKHVCKSIGINFVILRYQNVYGVGQSLLNPYTGILSIFSTQILSEKNINIFEDGLPTRDFINIEDTVDATIRSLEFETVNNKIINVGTGVATSVLSIAELLKNKFGRDTQINISGDFRIGDIRHNFADLSNMKKYLNFEPKIDLNEGIEEFTNWVLKQPIQENNFDKSLEEMKEKGFLKS